MRILKLTAKTEAALLKPRKTHDREAYRVAARIIADVQGRGHRALAEWSQKLDGANIAEAGLWISKQEMQWPGPVLIESFFVQSNWLPKTSAVSLNSNFPGNGK